MILFAIQNINEKSDVFNMYLKNLKEKTYHPCITHAEFFSEYNGKFSSAKAAWIEVGCKNHELVEVTIIAKKLDIVLGKL